MEAARIDGAGLLGVSWRIFLPLAIPAFVVVLIWQFTSIWNDFLFAVVLTSGQSWPITVALNNIAGKPDRRVERADGRRASGGTAAVAGLQRPWALLLARDDGGGLEGVSFSALPR